MRAAPHSLRHIVVAGVLSVTLFLAACAKAPLPPGATEQAVGLHAIWILFFWTGLGVAIFVYALIAWCIVRYRKPKDASSFPRQFRRNDKVEIAYTIVPILMVSALFIAAYATERHVEALSTTPTVVVNVTGYRWSWHFSYPQLGVEVAAPAHGLPTLVLPEGETTRLNISSVDVDHSFWVPAFLFKRDAIPGYKNAFDWKPTQLGTFRGECGEFCGLNHALMGFNVHVVTPAEFHTWTAGHHS